MGIFSVIIPFMNKLTATMRSKADKLGSVRINGMVPAVVYGARVENTMLSVSSVEFLKVLKVAGESSAIVLEVTDEKGAIKKIDALIHEVQFDPVKSFPIHVDFLAIDINKPVEVTIEVDFIGVAPAEKNNLGVLVKVLHKVDIEALPKDLPQKLEIDLSSLEALDDQIHAKDIKLPSGVKMLTEAEEVVALIAPMKEEKEEEAPAVDLSSIEIEKKGKKDEGGDGEQKAE